MEKKLEWTQHKAPPVPILADSNILSNSLYLYGVDFMSTDDVKNYFHRYSQLAQGVESLESEEDQFNVKWINDSSCVIKLPSA